jgi:hypothetical protein
MSCEYSKPWLERKTSTKLGPHDTIKKFLKHRCLKSPCVVHLDLICMSYDFKKGQESNWEFDFWPQIPWQQESDDVWLKHVINCWKNLFEDYKILPLHFRKKLIWEKYEPPKFWNSKSPNFGTPTWESRGKWHLDVVPIKKHRVYYREGSGASSQRLRAI